MESLSTLFPTDNLYKFLAIIGLVILAFCFIYPDIRLAELNQKVVVFTGEKQILEYESEEIGEEIYNIKEKVDTLMKETKIRGVILENERKRRNIAFDDSSRLASQIRTSKRNVTLLKDKNEREYFEFMVKYENDIYPARKKSKTVLNLLEQITKKSNFLDKKELKMIAVNSQIDLERKRIEYISHVGFVGKIAGFLLSVFGFTCWYLLSQKPQDEIIKFQLEEYRQKFSSDKKKIINP